MKLFIDNFSEKDLLILFLQYNTLNYNPKIEIN